MLSLLTALAIQVPGGAPAQRPDSVPPTAREIGRTIADSVRAGRERADSAPYQRTVRVPRRIPVTAEHLRTAYADAAARSLVERAREARLRQDSALLAYDAKTVSRLTLRMGLRAGMMEKLAARSEASGRVRWRRDTGIWMDITGSRTAAPIAGIDDDSDLDVNGAPIPYYPGRESLWFPSDNGGSLTKAEVDEREIVHPLATGAEAYYRYATGDSMTFILPDKRRIQLRELRITARKPAWNYIVGSFWFDVDGARLVRAAYRSSAPMEIWEFVQQEEREALTDIEADTALRRSDSTTWRKRRDDAAKDQDDVPRGVKVFFSPARFEITGVTVEYSLQEGRFWLPRMNSAQGILVLGFMRLPLEMQESFRYLSVNGTDSLPPLPAYASRGARDSAARAADDSLPPVFGPDSVAERHGSVTINLGGGPGKDSARVRIRNDSVARARRNPRAQCDTASSYVTTRTVHDGALRYAMRVPCDSVALAHSPDLPPSIYDKGEEVFGSADRDELMKSLTFDLQPGFSPAPPKPYWGMDLVRYNRVEGLSSAVGVRASLGGGYLADAQARLGVADLQPNAELHVARSNGRSTLTLGAFRRLAAANDRGAPLSTGSSLSHFLFARDEGFYYRTLGVELLGQRGTSGALTWRLFGERQSEAPLKTQFSLAHVVAGTRFIDNIHAERGTVAGGGATLAFARGLDPDRLRLAGDLRGEAAAGDFDYARTALDATLTRPITSRLTAALTGAAGYSGGRLPVQRLWYLGGSQTVRGQIAGTEAGDAFWLGRAEVARPLGKGMRVSLFGDMGWAGRRDDFLARVGTPMSGAGIGASVLDGLVRFDLARGIQPKQYVRLDMGVQARF